jgi:hypothetical protein
MGAELDGGVFACLKKVGLGSGEVRNGDEEIVESHQFESATHVLGNVGEDELVSATAGALLEANEQTYTCAVDESYVFEIEYDWSGGEESRFHFLADVMDFFEIETMGDLKNLKGS